MNKTPEEVYGQQRSQAWTRVDVLLALYDKAIVHVDAAIEAAKNLDQDGERGHRTTAIRTILGIAAGLDLSQGEIPQQIARLCDFMHHSLMIEGIERLQATRRVLMTLYEAFEGIRDEARRLEQQGEIPQFSERSTVQVSV